MKHVSEQQLVLYYYRSEEHTSELQSQSNLVCRLLLEKKKNHFVHHPGIAVVHCGRPLGIVSHTCAGTGLRSWLGGAPLLVACAMLGQCGLALLSGLSS